MKTTFAIDRSVLFRYCKKQTLFFYILAMPFLLSSFNTSAQDSGIYESYLIIDTNLDVNPNEFYDLQGSTASVNPDFIGANLGTYKTDDSFVLRGAEIKTYKCGSDDILNGQLYYRIYEQSATPPSFSNIINGSTTYLGFIS